jgi:hypothetical protein
VDDGVSANESLALGRRLGHRAEALREPPRRTPPEPAANQVREDVDSRHLRGSMFGNRSAETR